MNEEAAKYPTVELASLVGEHWLSGVDFGTVKETRYSYPEDCAVMVFMLDGVVYRAVEDPSDGYRNGLDRIEVIAGGNVSNRFEPVKVIGTHRLKGPESYSGEDDVLELRDAITGNLVLEVGTINVDDYYPSYVGYFYPEAMAVNAATP